MKPVKYFARLRICNDYPANGTVQWCVVDNLGGYIIMESEETAIAEAERRNQEVGNAR